MNFNRRRHESVGSPSLSSLIDVVFLLLAYFVLTAAFALPERALTPAISVDGQGADFATLATIAGGTDEGLADLINMGNLVVDQSIVI